MSCILRKTHCIWYTAGQISVYITLTSWERRESLIKISWLRDGGWVCYLKGVCISLLGEGSFHFAGRGSVYRSIYQVTEWEINIFHFDQGSKWCLVCFHLWFFVLRQRWRLIPRWPRLDWENSFMPSIWINFLQYTNENIYRGFIRLQKCFRFIIQHKDIILIHKSTSV